ncbi:MAG: NADH-quinone oxidoreductase subunit J [Candidatus Abyssobacteria bacterium SURF_5]|uniref:NADH-quinone oxidoreductase subunit J n=1 Tax=Abyssobacteria bacterium (strain SURF_5) TaxID=2093360 RepID=A0A3A4NPK8_ABYX5|nr:MAG: NADH-quinone oxidoreductase subunit J [Candidatus Abyssubacteria bacterium SURF_5]
MNTTFYVTAAVGILSTLFVITSLNAVHALLFFIVSLLATSLIFYILGAPFAAMLVIIINAGAIMVLFVFAIMILNLGPHMTEYEKPSFQPRQWVFPVFLALILIGEFVFTFFQHSPGVGVREIVDAKRVGIALFGPYVLGVEMASLLLLAGLLGAYHLGPYAINPREAKK